MATPPTNLIVRQLPYINIASASARVHPLPAAFIARIVLCHEGVSSRPHVVEHVLQGESQEPARILRMLPQKLLHVHLHFVLEKDTVEGAVKERGYSTVVFYRTMNTTL